MGGRVVIFSIFKNARQRQHDNGRCGDDGHDNAGGRG
jgi:hypothetical protein